MSRAGRSQGKAKGMSKTKSLELLRKKQESGFSVMRTGSELPEYKAELDPYCPRAQVRKYNQDKKLDAEARAAKAKNADGFIKKRVHSNVEDVPLKFNPSLRAKATSAATKQASDNPENVEEVEILQKVIVRENLLEELKKLLAHQTDVTACMGEVIELVKAVRFQTVEIIEEISTWSGKQPSRRAFLYRGVNYLTKIFEDLNFLDLYEDIVERFCFEFTGNPLGYRGGGDIVTGPGGSANKEGMKRLAEFYNDNQGAFDGLEIVRLRNAEKVIQMEFDRLDKEKRMFAKHQAALANMTPQQRAMAQEEYNSSNQRDGSVMVGELGMASVAEGESGIMASQDELASATLLIQQQEAVHSSKKVVKKGEKVPKADPRKWRQKFNPKKVKMERIQTLTAEADELRAMETHLEDQINTMVTLHHELAEKRKLAEARRREALESDREVAAQHLTVEISMATTDMQDLNAKIKDLQRKIYFIAIERSRKRKVAKKLKDELKLEKKRAELEQELAVKVKEGGILKALKTLNTMQSSDLEANLGVQASSSQEGKEENPILGYIHQFQQDSLAEARANPEGVQVQFEENRREFGDNLNPNEEDIPEEEEKSPSGQYDHISTRDLADAALAGMRAGRSTLGDDLPDGTSLGQRALESGAMDPFSADEYQEGDEATFLADDSEGLEDEPVGSATNLARSRPRRPSDGSKVRIVLQQAQDKFDHGEYGEARELLEDILNPVEGSTKSPDAIALLGARLLLAEWHRALAQYEASESMYVKCVTEIESMTLVSDDVGIKSTLHLRILVGYGDLLRNLCLYDELEPVMYKAEKLADSVNPGVLKGETNNFRLAVAECRTSQAAFLVAKGDYDEAERLHRDALDLRRQVLGLDHFKVASSLSHLGHVALLKSDFKKAARLIGEGLAMREVLFSGNHPAVAASLYLRGRLLHLIGQYKESGPLLARSLQMRKICLSQRHPSVGQAQLAIGELSRDMGWPMKAADSYNDAFKALSKAFPDGGRSANHRLRVDACMGLGNNFYSLQQYGKALDYYRSAAECHTHLMPEKMVQHHVYREYLHLKQARVLVCLDRFDEAKQIVSTSGQVLVTKLGNDHHQVAEGLLVFGRLCSLCGNFAQAHLLLQRSKEMFMVSFNEEHPIMLELMLTKSDNMRLPGYYEDAAFEEGKARQLSASLFSNTTSHTGLALYTRALLLRDTRRLTEAHPLFQESLRVLELALGAGSATYALALGEFGELQRLMGKHEDARNTLQEAVVLARTVFAHDDPTRKKKAIDHSSVALFQMYDAHVMLDTGDVEEALNVLEAEVYPSVRGMLGAKHPLTQYSKALAALCLQKSKTPRTERSLVSADLLEEQPQDIIDEVLEYLDTFDDSKSPYSEEHPWVLSLGGYVMDTERSSRNASARRSARQSARGSARGVESVAKKVTNLEPGQDLLDSTSNSVAPDEGTWQHESHNFHSHASHGKSAVTEEGGQMMHVPPIDPELVPWQAQGKEGKDYDRIGGKIVFSSNVKFDGEKAKSPYDLHIGYESAKDKYEMGKLEECKDVIEDVLKARRRLQIGNNYTVVSTRYLLAEWHRAMGQYKHAESLYTKCLAVMQSQEAEGFSDALTLHMQVLVGFADLNRNLCQYTEVTKVLEQTDQIILAAKEKGVEQSDSFRLAVAECRTSQAAFLVAKGDYDEAERLHRDALDLRRQVLGLDHFKVASSLSHLGHVALLKSDFKRSERLLTESMEMRISIFPNIHPAIAASLYLQGRLLHAAGRNHECGALFAQALSIRKSCLGNRHPSVAQTVWAMGEVTLALGFTERAGEHLDDSLLQRQQSFPEVETDPGKERWHLTVLESIASAAALAEAQGDYFKATETYGDAIKQSHRISSSFGVQDGRHPQTALLQIRLARIYVATNKIHEAKHVLKRAGDVVFSRLGDRHIIAAELYYSLGQLCNHEGWYMDAHECYAKAQKVMYTLFKTKEKRPARQMKIDLSGSGLGPSSVESLVSEEMATSPTSLEDRLLSFQGIDPDFNDSATDVAHSLYADILHAQAYNLAINGPGYLKHAMKLAVRAFEVRKTLFAKTHMDDDFDGRDGGLNQHNLNVTILAMSLHLCGQIAALRREFGEGAQYFELALKIAHDCAGEKSAQFAIVFATYGAFLLQHAEAVMNSGDEIPEHLLEEADDTLSKALMLLRYRLGDGHYMVAETMQHIAFLLLYRGQVEEALALMKDGALPLFEESLGHGNPRTLFVGGCVGVCLQAVARAHDAAAAQEAIESGKSVVSSTSAGMTTSGRELVKSTLNFFRSYEQGPLVGSHHWVASLGSYEALLQKPEPTATTDDTSTSAHEHDHELENIRSEVANIPLRPELGLLFNRSLSKIADLDWAPPTESRELV